MPENTMPMSWPAGNGAILYDYPRAPSSQRVRIALALKSVVYVRQAVDIRAGVQDDMAFRARSPQGFVPVLCMDGHTLHQSIAIIEYIDETVAGVSLIPQDPAGRARVRRLAHVIASGAGPLTNLSLLSDVQSRFGKSARLGWLMEQYSTSLSQLEIQLQDADTGEFCHGDTPTLADCVFAPHANAAWRWGLDLRALPCVSRIFQRCLEMPEFARNLRECPQSSN